MARALVIGGTLLIGRTLVEQLLARGDEVVIMHRGHGTAFGSRVREIHCDRNDVKAVASALAHEQFDVVYDNVYDWQRGTSAEQVSAAATASAKGLRRYVFTSSVAVFAPGGPYDEDGALVPSDFANAYGAQKADSERALFALGRTQGIPVTTIRPAFIFGPHNAFDREAFFWDRIVADRPVIIPGDGLSTMQWISSRDVARAAIAATVHDAAIGRGYNLANVPEITQLDFVRLLARVADKEVEVVHVPRETIAALGGGIMEPPVYFGAYLDIPPITVRNNRLRTDLELELTSLEDGLEETFRWYAAQQRPTADFSWDEKAIAAAE
ncbi:NAD-dependent epimerase/dehydratase family protein [Gemmatimonas sp.]|uniref:NAD-dependent epimerase/dehydratase family protein n=1 Tax=Gemmatimonas sp. TaxID=1962908 RepID=UPI003983298B